MTLPVTDPTEAEYIRQLQASNPIRVLHYLDDRDGEHMLHVTHQIAVTLYPLLHAMGDKDMAAAGKANRYLNGVFHDIKNTIDKLDEERAHNLRKEYHRVLQQNDGARYKALAAAFPDLVTRKRFWKVTDFPADQITSDHLAYMILGGIIGRVVPVFRKVTGIKNVIIYDPDNTIVAKTQRGTGQA